MTDEREELKKLIKNASDGSTHALSELYERYKPLIESEVRRHTNPDMTNQDIDDLRQEAMICFCRAVCNYEYSEDGVEFGLYAKICIGNALVSYLRYYNRHKNNRVISIDDVVKFENKCEFSDPMDKLIEEENFRNLERRIQSSLSPYESKVWWMYVSGMSAQEIALRLDGVDVRSVNNAIYRIRKKLRSVLGEK